MDDFGTTNFFFNDHDNFNDWQELYCLRVKVVWKLENFFLNKKIKHFLLHNGIFLVSFYFYNNRNYFKLKIENRKFYCFKKKILREIVVLTK